MSCPHCVEGVLAEGTPEGYEKSFGGLDTYFTKHEGNTKCAIVMATDVFGFEFVNARLIADSIARDTGFLVLIPDVFNRGGLSVSVFLEQSQEERLKMLAEFQAKQGPPDSKLPIFRNILKELREKKGIETIGVVGYCYGGRISAKLAAEDQTTANVIAHPSPLKIPEEIEAIKKPTLWLCAENDFTFPTSDRQKAEEILRQQGTFAEFRDYPGTVHGFASRGDDKNPVVREAKKDALKATIDFFSKHLA